MIIDEETVDKIAHLARLELSAEEKQEMIGDMSKILDFMAKLNEINTAGVEPLVYMTNEVNVMREDIVKQEITHQEALLNAPRHDGEYFLVPKVIAREESGKSESPEESGKPGSPKVRKKEKGH